MKPLPRLLLGYLAFIISFMAVMFLFDGKEMNWKKNLIMATIVGAFTLGGLYLLGKRKKGN
jgi:hypothetical protein